jgi:hypothetical protein
MDRPARNVWARGELRRHDLEEAAVTEKVTLASKFAILPHQDGGTSPNGKTLSAFQLTIGITMAGHQDARYIPPRRQGTVLVVGGARALPLGGLHRRPS